MKSLRLLLIVAAAWVSVWSTAAQAIPAFARQTAKPCTACHFQHFPALNAFGREFKASGYTLKSMIPEHDDYIEADNLSIPAVLNASVVAKMRYQKDNGKDDPATAGTDESKTGRNKGELQFPDEAALLIGGRASEHVGFLLEASLVGTTEEVGALTAAQVAGSGVPAHSHGFSIFANFKMPIIYDVGGTKVGVIPFTTDTGGPAYGFELFNTGALNMHTSSIREGTLFSAQQFIVGETPAEGFAFVARNDFGFVNATLWGPAHGAVDTGFNLSQYLRAAATPRVGEWDLGVGVQYWGGETKVGDTTNNPGQVYVTKAMAIDGQAQGTVGAMPLGVYVTYGKAAAPSAGATSTSLYNANPNDRKAWSVLAELGVVPNSVTIGLGYRKGDTGAAANADDNVTIVGVSYLLAQNVQLVLNQASKSGSAYDTAVNPTGATNRTTLMLFAAF